MLAEFDAAVRAGGDRPPVLVLTGIGGIGKSRLLSEIRDRAEELPTALLDLQVPSLRQAENALAVLRGQFGQRTIQFPRFDIAYTVLWQRLHPRLTVSKDQLSIVEHSEILTEIINDTSGAPVFATAAKLTDLVARKVNWIREDQTLRTLDRLTLPELAGAVSYLLAEDLRAATGDNTPYVVLIDAYEALATDRWLRKLVAQLDRGLVVVASREPLGWQRHDAGWARRLRTLRVDDLPMPARHELLTAAGVTDPVEQRAIAVSSAGVPFYLHLAIDARAAGGPDRLPAPVAQEQILEHFLHHVSADEVFMLELLSVSPVFDREIFDALAEAFGLSGHRTAWESITAYSFIQRAGSAERVALHKLMVSALRDRLSGQVTADLHRLLRDLWDERATSAAERLVALREAAYHALWSGEASATDLLDYADRIATFGGRQEIDGLLADLAEFLSEVSDGSDPRAADVADLSWYLQVERALLLGDAERANSLTRTVPDDPSGLIAGRLAVAAAHARRIQGRTADALRIYSDVWARGAGPARLGAGLWIADLDMCQGRFADAVDMAGRLLAECPAGDHELRGDIARLLNLAYRFSFHLDAAAEQLAIAEQQYRQAGGVVANANIATNRAELLAFTDPEEAIGAAGVAIEANRELGALHEEGKAYTALGIAQLMRSDLVRAEHAFDRAVEILDRVGYRSGRARAELFRAVLLARRGEPSAAVASARRAVSGLEAAAVYPTWSSPPSKYSS